jgi:hypothetical protein
MDMVRVGLFRFGAPAEKLIPLGQLQRIGGVDQRELQRQLQALDHAGIDLTGWKALFMTRSIVDLMNDRFVAGAWPRIERLRMSVAGPVVLGERLPGVSDVAGRSGQCRPAQLGPIHLL